MCSLKVSVLVPVYGVEKGIERCVRSLMEQTMADGVEFIFCNDATKDRSMEILRDVVEQYPARRSQIKIIENEQNQGRGTTRVKLFEAAQGDYIIYLDSDDWVEADMIEAMYNLAQAKKADMVFCDYYKEVDNIESYFSCKLPDDKIEHIRTLIIGHTPQTCMVYFWNKLISKKLFEKSNVHRMLGMDYGEDLPIVVSIVNNASNIVHLDRALYHYNVESASTRSNTLWQGKVMTLFKVVDMVAADLNGVSSDFEEAIETRRFTAKLRALIHSRGEWQQKVATMYPELDFKKLRNNVEFDLRGVYKLALKGHLRPLNSYLRVRSILIKLTHVLRGKQK